MIRPNQAYLGAFVFVTLVSAPITSKAHASDEEICMNLKEVREFMMQQIPNFLSPPIPRVSGLSADQYDALSGAISILRRDDSQEKVEKTLPVPFSTNNVAAKGPFAPVRGYALKIVTARYDRDSASGYDQEIFFNFSKDRKLRCVQTLDPKLNPQGLNDLLDKNH